MPKQTKSYKSKSKNKQRINTRTMVPSRYPRPVDDVVSITTHTLLNISSSIIGSGPYAAAGLVVLGKGTDAVGYTFLNSLSSLFNAMSTCYTRFMVTDLKVVGRSPAVTFSTGGQFFAASYIPSDSTTENPPNDEDEVAQARHMCVVTPGVSGSFRVNPSDYYNDWKNISDIDDSDKQAGLIQYYGKSSGAGSGLCILDLEITIAFCGLRK